jgi:hypothetical protein
MNNASAHALLGTKHRTKSNKTKSTTQKHANKINKETKYFTLSEQFQNQITKSQKEEKIDIPNT